MTPLQERVTSALPHLEFKLDFPLAALTYFKIGGPAEIFFEAKSRDQLIEIVRFCRQNDLPLTILAGASNVIVSDAGIPGVVLKPANDEYEVLPDKDQHNRHIVRVGSGIKTAIFVRKTVDSGLKGLEYFLGVPGHLSGAIYNNAHYLSDLIGQHVHRVEVIGEDGTITWLTNEECQFAYDYSRFHKTKDVLVSAEFALHSGSKEESMELIKKATLYRANTQPLGEPSSGCYFRNTLNTEELKKRFPQFAERRECPSAFLIDQAGLKGKQVGGIKVSEKHAAFLVNTGNGTSAEVKQLAEIIKQRVKDEFGVELQPEVFWLGE
jgi:UDP-N-acetylmuramate dehydrogenase